MSDDIIPDGDEWDRPAEYQFTAPLRMVEMLRSDLNNDVSFLSLNHFAILLIIFEMEDERFGIEAQTIHSLAAVEKSTANRIVHSLSDKGRGREGLGYIRVETDVNDRRIRRIFLTEKGRFLKQQMAAAGTSHDNTREVQKMHQAYDATRMQSLEKAYESEKGSASDVAAKNSAGPYKVRKSEGRRTYTSGPVRITIPNKSSRLRFTLDRSMKFGASGGRDFVRYQGNDVTIISAEEIRKYTDLTKYELIKTSGYWMLFATSLRDGEADAVPLYIQRNLDVDALSSYMNKLVDRLQNGLSFSDIMGEAARFLNQTEYGRLRNQMTKDLAGTRDTLMRETAMKRVEADGLSSNARDARWRAGSLYRAAHTTAARAHNADDFDKTERANFDAVAKAVLTESDEQNDAAEKMEAEADALRNQVDAMQDSMAQMQAMMKQMMDKGEKP